MRARVANGEAGALATVRDGDVEDPFDGVQGLARLGARTEVHAREVRLPRFPCGDEC